MNKVIIYTTDYCPYCRLAKTFLSERHLPFQEIRIDLDEEKRMEMMTLSQRKTVPQIFINDYHVGGYDDLIAMAKTGKLDDLLNP